MQVWSSWNAKFVDITDDEYMTWLDAGGEPTKIDAINSLGETLFAQFPAGAPQTVAVVRAKRDNTLAACDWIAVRQADTGTLSDAQWAAWKTYRQARRDLPARKRFPADVV
ncbi:Phage tail protein [Burkholderia sp. IT-111MI5]